MKNAIGAVVILFICYLHLLVVPPRNLRGSYYKNPGRDMRTCAYEHTCNGDGSFDSDGRFLCSNSSQIEYDMTDDTHTCTGVCLTYRVTNISSSEVYYTGRRCIEYCEDYCVEIWDGLRSCFECCYGNNCNAP
ncbi:hypothetical protein HOLleu_01439 [Holothuria leucospilota]|uniref:Uncharacterized protein n=1 Tax=Holothuria leucospilota TaxID=206669 RepID=A0A9Q1HJ86_HOLLE|nr:hypothetical protein HOLleu_01439 [Holothuria leucospilota]